MANLLIGTCGFCMGQARYFRDFRLIEVQQTFYQPPQISTVRKWRERAPVDFEFTLKAFQAITHPPASPTYRRCRLSATERSECGSFRNTKIVQEAWDTTRSIALELRARVVVFQCPVSFKPVTPNIKAMRRFFESADRAGLRFAWEPRGSTWAQELVGGLCHDLDLIHVIDPLGGERGTLMTAALPGPIRYLRLHGITGYRYRYTDADLQRLRTQCTARTTYCLFNNMSMCEDAQRFEERYV